MHWLTPVCIQNNIVFGSPLDEDRYKKGQYILYDVIITISNIYIAIDHCALAHDLSLFEAGDETEVGEKGITLR